MTNRKPWRTPMQQEEGTGKQPNAAGIHHDVCGRLADTVPANLLPF